MWLFDNRKQRLKKASLEYTKAVLGEFDEKIRALTEDLKNSDNEMDIIKIKFSKLNLYLEAIVTICQTHTLDKEIKEKISQLYQNSKKIKIN